MTGRSCCPELERSGGQPLERTVPGKKLQNAGERRGRCPHPATTLHAAIRAGSRGASPFRHWLYSASAASFRGRARYGAKASGQAKQKHRAPVRYSAAVAATQERFAVIPSRDINSLL